MTHTIGNYIMYNIIYLTLFFSLFFATIGTKCRVGFKRFYLIQLKSFSWFSLVFFLSLSSMNCVQDFTLTLTPLLCTLLQKLLIKTFELNFDSLCRRRGF